MNRKAQKILKDMKQHKSIFFYWLAAGATCCTILAFWTNKLRTADYLAKIAVFCLAIGALWSSVNYYKK